MALQIRFVSIVLALVVVGYALPGRGQVPQRAPAPAAVASGRISGTVIDQSGAVVSGALVSLTQKDQPAGGQSAARQMLSGDDGQFSFAEVVPGGFQITITAAGFASQTASGILRPGEVQIVPAVTLGVATTSTDVEVGLTRAEVAEEEIKVQEKQRVLGVLPNFYVSYVADPVPLTSKQKFEIAWKTLIDPATLIFVGGAAGIEQAQNHFEEYGQGAEGFGKRFGAGYADTATGTLIGSALLPSLLKQDPRYFYKGTGSTRSRFLYAVANSFVCKGDNGRWQPSYSNILGSLAAGGISNLYYPSRDRNGAGLTFENGAIGIGATAAANLFQEFIVRKLTPKVPHSDPGQP
jgi:Carboxypeptidase regulatory-like domain